ncbi:MAG: hypothetical protein BZ135_06030 [Methanosphaera sp. rholeuAM6]|nr:MAG: hypothetical protein BZ135_06030 [Methanosphaera sp. rholeuAM6]
MNKNMKAIFLFATLAIVMIGIGCVSAAEIDETGAVDSIEEVAADATPVTTESADIVKNIDDNVKTASGSSNEYKVTEKTYSKYFDANSTLKNNVVTDNSNLILSGTFNNKDFVFDNIKLTVSNDGSATLKNTVITVQNKAQVTFDGLKIDNKNKDSDYVILLETKSNTIKNSKINVKSDDPIHAIEVSGDNNKIIDTTVNVIAPSADVVYDANYVGTPATSGIYISSSKNLIDNVTLTFDGSKQVGYFPSVDAIDIQSTGYGKTVTDNAITNSRITVKGNSYVYGVSVGRSKNTKLTETTFNVTSAYYSDAVQLFDAEDTQVSGTIYSSADSEAYGLYSTAMGSSFSKGIDLTGLDITCEAPLSTAVLVEGSSDTVMADATYNVKGTNASAIICQEDWMGNTPNGLTATNMVINLDKNAKKYAMGFYKAKNIKITDNKINSKKGSEISFVQCEGGQVTDNYIVIGDLCGNAAVTSDSKDTAIKNNIPNCMITDKTYSNYFDDESVLKAGLIKNNSIVLLHGNFKNKDFTFGNIKATVTGDGILYNTTITVENNAKITFDKIKINNINHNDGYAVLLDTKGNVIQNSNIKVKSDSPIHAIEVSEDSNKILNSTVNVTAPSSDVEYDAKYVGTPQTSGIYISSSKNLVDNVKLIFDGTEQVGYFPSVDGVDIQSKGFGETITDNIINNSRITVTGSNYVYGINMGRSKNTKMTGTRINVTSSYYSAGVQLFDAYKTSLSGTVYASAGTEAYGIYSTAMGSGYSKEVNATGLNINLDAKVGSAVLLEGSSNNILADSKYTVKGENVSAVESYIDWMGNVPKNTQVNNVVIKIDTTGNDNVLYFGACDGVTITNNNIKSSKGSEILFNSTTNAKVTDNYIVVSKVTGDDAVKTTENDTIVKNNKPVTKKGSVITINPVGNVIYRDTVKITGSITSVTGVTLGHTNIYVTFNGEQQHVTSDVKGVFRASFKCTQAGTQDVVVEYNGNTKYLATSANTTVKVLKRDTKLSVKDISETLQGTNVVITGKLTSSEGINLGNTNIYISVNGVESHVKATKGGVFTYSYEAKKVGNNVVKVTYKGNSNYNGCDATTKFTVTTSKLIIYKVKDVIYRNNYTIRGKLTDKNGKAIANAKVQLKVNDDKAVSVKTNSDGIYVYSAKASMSGKNTVVATYKDSSSKSTATKTFNVFKRETSLTVDKISNVKVNSKVTVTGQLTDETDTLLRNCNIYVSVDGLEKHVTTNNDGIYTSSFTVKTTGTKKVDVIYKGNSNYDANEVHTSFKVTA